MQPDIDLAVKLGIDFARLWKRIGAQGNPGPVYGDLVRRYSEPHRAYHTMNHIAHCMRELEQVPDHLCNKDIVELALWFHDAIYGISPIRPITDNEERSAELAARVLADAGIDFNMTTFVIAAILDTRHDESILFDTSQYTVDVDLSIFGQPPDIWEKSSEQIRREYRYVPWFLYRKKRRQILQGFLDRSYGQGIYFTDFFRDKYEQQARENLTHAIAELKK